MLVFSTRSGRSLIVSSKVWGELARGDYSLLQADAQARLVEAEVLVPCAANERLTLTDASRAASRNVRTLTRMILPTAYCQLGCSYCGQKHTRKVMDRGVMDGLIKDVETSLSTGRFNRLLITWFGGEPTTAPDVIRYLSGHLIRTCEELGVRYESRMITNGLALSLPLTRMLVQDCRVSVFTISLDGPEAIHDSRRATKTGKGTFARILDNIKEIARSAELTECALHIRVNIDKDNAPYIHEFIEILADLQLAKRVKVDLAVVVPWALRSHPEIIDRADFAGKEVGWLGHLLSRGFRVNLLPTPRASACLAAEPSSAVVAHDGVLHNCALTPLALHEITRSTRPLGHVNFKDAEQGLHRHNDVFKLVSSSEVPCHNCKYLFLCQGSCPKDIEKGLLNCPGYKFNLPARMVLDFLMKTRRGRGPKPEPAFDFSLSGLDNQKQNSVREIILGEIALFRSRFALFRAPDEVVVHSADRSEALSTVEERGGRTRWNHHLQTVTVARGRSTAALTEELAECYLSQINPNLYDLYQNRKSPEARALARGFIDWVSSLLRGGYQAAARDATRGVPAAMRDISRHACIEHFMAQPPDSLLRVTRDLIYNGLDSQARPADFQASAASPASGGAN